MARHRHPHILNTPNCGRSGIGAFSVAAKARPSTSRVCAGSMMPSSHSRAVACQGLPSRLVILADRLLEGFGLLGRPFVGVAVDGGEHARGLLAAHHADAASWAR